MYNNFGRCQKSVADASGLLQRICILWPVPGLRLSRPSGARDTNNAITVESEREREKTVKSRVPPPPNNYTTTTIEDEQTMRCGGGVDDGSRGAVVVVVCAAELYRLRSQRCRCRTANVFLFARQRARLGTFVCRTSCIPPGRGCSLTVYSSLYGFPFAVGQR